jgi:hypothetical protein
MAKNISSSPMVFTTKILYKLFRLDELLGHNVSGKTFNKFIKNKKALDEKRISYIRWLVEKYFEADNKEELWKACRTAINKSIRNHEIKEQQAQNKQLIDSGSNIVLDHNNNETGSSGSAGGGGGVALNTSTNNYINLQPNMTIVQITNDLPPVPNDLDESKENFYHHLNINSENRNVNVGIDTSNQIIIRLTDDVPVIVEEHMTINDENSDKTYIDLSKPIKLGKKMKF